MKKMPATISAEEIRVKILEKREGYLTKMRESGGKIADYFTDVSAGSENLYLEVHFSEIRSLAKAIKLKCLDCSCWSREEVKLCATEQCGLHKVRPYK